MPKVDNISKVFSSGADKRASIVRRGGAQPPGGQCRQPPRHIPLGQADCSAPTTHGSRQGAYITSRLKVILYMVTRDSVQNFDILWGGKWDQRESENSTLHAIWTLLMVETSIFP